MPMVLARIRFMPQAAPLPVDAALASVRIAGCDHALAELDWEPPIGGTVYGTLLNYHGALAALGDAVHAPPYRAPPRAPVLYIKPANTHIGCGAGIPVPDGIDELAMGASLALVVGRTAYRVSEQTALEHVLGYTIANDVSVPHASFYRPAVRQQCRDGFCPMGPWIMPAARVSSPDALQVRVYINGALRQENSTTNLVRPVARLLADGSEFMTLFPGYVLRSGVPEDAPLARVGEIVRIDIEGIGQLQNMLVAQRDWASGAPA